MKRSIGVGVAVVAAVIALLFMINRNDYLPPSPDGNVPILEPDHLTLYSIEPQELRGKPGSMAPADAEVFHLCPVLGKTQIADADDRRAIMRTLQAAARPDDEFRMMCFEPHHAIRIEHAGRTIDYVICFHCQRIHMYDGPSSRSIATSADPQSLFDRYLTAAHVPLAPRE
ncbi:MAG: hypothetical protein GC162_01130 [Planctomycetes bacterium]|nr:hypothetical protein [Planctomycetota bacterium]